MAIFTGNIIEAYYANPENTAVEVIYKDGDRAINHYMLVDMTHNDFRDLIEEYPMSKLADSTIQRNKNTMGQLARLVDSKVQEKLDDKPLKDFNSALEFIINYDPKKQAEELFSLKLKIFDLEIIKDHKGNEEKKLIRQAKTPLEVLMAYKDIVEQQRK